ncbi:hypothetical protein HK096_003827, partial [Nowakowskiella sp. JEL0078]
MTEPLNTVLPKVTNLVDQNGPNIQPRDFMPNFENMLLEGSHNVSGSFALVDGLTFMSFGAKAIAQDEFSLAFRQKPRTKFSVRLLLLPAYC